jgi:hypothetical protein
MSWDLLLRHCAATRATIVQIRVSADLAENQVAAMETFARQQLDRAQVGHARIELPATCEGYPADDCGRQTPDAVIVSGRVTEQRMCRGCALTLL